MRLQSNASFMSIRFSSVRQPLGACWAGVKLSSLWVRRDHPPDVVLRRIDAFNLIVVVFIGVERGSYSEFAREDVERSSRFNVRRCGGSGATARRRAHFIPVRWEELSLGGYTGYIASRSKNQADRSCRHSEYDLRRAGGEACTSSSASLASKDARATVKPLL